MRPSDLDIDWLNTSANRIEQTLAGLSLPARIEGGDVGTDSVSFHLVLPEGVNNSRVAQAAREIAKAVGVADVQVSVQPQGLSIDVPLMPDRSLRMLPLLDALEDLEPLTALVGMSEQGRPLTLDLRRRDSRHLWIEGPSGSGKSELLRTLVVSLALGSRPSQMRLLGIDVRGRDLGIIEAMPHALGRVATTPGRAFETIGWLEREVDRRLNKGIRQPAIVLAMDDLAWMDLRPSGALMGSFRRMLSQADWVGVHLIAAARSIRMPNLRRTITSAGLTKAVHEPGEDGDFGWFEFRSASGSRRRARIAWMSAADLQTAAARASARMPLGSRAMASGFEGRMQ